ncbi:MAG: hypothetical protein AAGA62_06125 [Bacteroidota bacterium]
MATLQPYYFFNEEDSSHFEVERSTNGNSWPYLGEVTPLFPKRGRGRAYTFPDEATTTYYRLKMVDLDGTFTYSELIYLENNAGAGAGAMRVYSNPTSGPYRSTLHGTNPTVTASQRSTLP